MVTFRNNNNRRNNFRRSARSFKSNGDNSKYGSNFSNNENFKTNNDNSKFGSNFSNNDNFKRKSPGRNNHNAPKLIEKYNDLAREALSNGDKILSENYLQHADHFTRILSERENYRREKNPDFKSENNLDNIEENVDNTDKSVVEAPNEETKLQKVDKIQSEIN